MVDFELCAARFANFSQHNSTFNYTKKPVGIFSDPGKRPPLITYEGCKALCGSGNQYYAWADISSTITNWVFPVVGLLLQAPYESNKNWSTLLALARWVGNPIAGMAYTFWNIGVTGRCATMVDMATPYDEIPEPDSHFAQIRDSLCLLSVMNQYTIEERTRNMDAAEKLLYIALFSDRLQLTAVDDRSNSLIGRREELARIVRIGRKKGVIEVFLSEMLFMIALAISIYAFFNETGSNRTVHQLGIGLLLSWLPVLVLSSITDRNPVAADEIRHQLNNFLDSVRTALLDPGRRDLYIKAIGRTEDEFTWAKHLEDDPKSFFTHFAGQGRVRWHHGCANSILASMEHAYIADRGRGWTDNADWARTCMISGVELGHPELVCFDRQMFWQIAGSTAIFYGTTGGAIMIAYFTPTVGLSCWSGGYVIYMVIATVIFAVEMLLWRCRTIYPDVPRWLRYLIRDLPFEGLISYFFRHARPTLDRQRSSRWVIIFRLHLRTLQKMWLDLSFTDRLDAILRLLEIGNTVFLTYIVFAQSIGTYSNCNCYCGVWSSVGGYMDFETYAYYRESGVLYYWGFGTGVSCLFLAAGLIKVMIEYFTQTHLSTEDYHSAAQGLRTTRRFKKYTAWLRIPGDFLAKCMHKVTFGVFKSSLKSLVWDSRTKDERIQMKRAPVVEGQLSRRSSEALALTPLGEDVQKQWSPISNTVGKRSQDRQRAHDASVQELNNEGDTDLEMQPIPEALPKVEDSD